MTYSRIKKYYRFCTAYIGILVLVGWLCVPLQTAAAALVLNGDFEQASAADSSQPVSWFPDSWGQNTAVFSYLNEGHGGSHAVRTTITNYQNGDAKWLFNAVPVSAGAQYDYSDWYRSSATTNVWARFEMQDGTVQYQWLKAVGAGSAWVQVAVVIAVPANALRMNVFHVLSANGQLDVDDVSMVQKTSCAPVYQHGLANGGFEQTCPSSPDIPVGWQSQTYGPDPATYTYGTGAHQGTHAVAITTSTTNDEAGWTTNVQSSLPNQRYSLSFWQSGNVYVYAYVTETMSDNSTQDVALMSVPATYNVWSKYRDSFVTPANLKALKITIATSGQGTVTLDDVALDLQTNQIPTSFANGMVSLTFDDGIGSTYTNGASAMTLNGFKGTYYINGDTVDAPNYMTSVQLKTLATTGNEIGSHLYHHSDMTQLDTPTLISELTGNKTDLQNIIGTNYPINEMASPYGSYTSGDVDTVMQYEQSHRDTDGLMNTKANLDTRQIHGRLVKANTTTAELTSWINDAKSQKAWLVLVYHGISTPGSTTTPDGEQGYEVTPTNFKNQLAAIKQSGIAVRPVNMALPALLAQE